MTSVAYSFRNQRHSPHGAFGWRSSQSSGGWVRWPLPLELSATPGEEDSCGYSHLPRLYVGPFPPVPSMTRNTISITWTVGVRIKLTNEQSHYLTKVMRIFRRSSKRARGKKASSSSAALVRIFDGCENGEWLAQVEEEEEIQEGGESRRKRLRGSSSSLPLPLVATCVEQLRSPANDSQRFRPPLPWIFFAPLKRQRAKLMLEKCTELGVGTFVPIISDRTDAASVADCGLLPEQHQHQRQDDSSSPPMIKLWWQAREAAEQCERLTIPHLLTRPFTMKGNDRLDNEESTSPLTLKEFLQQWESDLMVAKKFDGGLTQPNRRILLVCREREKGEPVLGVLRSILPFSGTEDDKEDATETETFSNRQTGRHAQLNPIGIEKKVAMIGFLVGPEGGWSPEEEHLFDEYDSCETTKKQSIVRSVSLGSSVLRAETAAMMAAGAWSLHCNHYDHQVETFRKLS